jgi:hypothetical protein
MAVTNFSPLLGLALPTTGDLSGTWGTTVNDSITSLIDSSVAGTTTLNTDANVTLSTTNGAANQARNAVLLCTGARTTLKTITAPAQSKAYIVINATTGGYSVQVVGAGPTTGVTILNNEKALIAWNGSDFVKVASSSINLGDVVGVLAPVNGGTGTSAVPTNGQIPIGNGTNYTAATLTAGSGVTITNSSGGISIAATGSGGTVTSVTASSPVLSSGGSTPNISFLAAGTNGNVLTSNGSTWTSSPPVVTAGKSIAFALVFGT